MLGTGHYELEPFVRRPAVREPTVDVRHRIELVAIEVRFDDVGERNPGQLQERNPLELGLLDRIIVFDEGPASVRIPDTPSPAG